VPGRSASDEAWGTLTPSLASFPLSLLQRGRIIQAQGYQPWDKEKTDPSSEGGLQKNLTTRLFDPRGTLEITNCDIQ